MDEAETRKDEATVILHAEVDGVVNTEVLTLDCRDYPCLTELLKGPEREPLQRELAALVSRFWQARSQRQELGVFAKLLVKGVLGEEEEKAVFVQDISKNGIKLAVLRSGSLDLMQLAEVRILLQLGSESPEDRLDIKAQFARVAGFDEKYAYLAFRFDALKEEQARRLDQASNLLMT